MNLTEVEVKYLINTSKKILIEQPTFLDLEAPLTVCGDTHGQYPDLLRLFELGGYPPDTNYLFLGDYVDRGKQSLETICLLLCYKIKYPEKVTLLRGNHESSVTNRIYGFYDECKRRYNVKLWKSFTELFNYSNLFTFLLIIIFGLFYQEIFLLLIVLNYLINPFLIFNF